MQTFAHIDAEGRVLGFFIEGIHPEIPTPSVAISTEVHAELLAGQSEGKVMAVGAGGEAVLLAPPPPSLEILANAARMKRDAELTASDFMILRHRDELEEGIATTLSTEQYQALIRYRGKLRNVPEQAGFPTEIDWPEMPLS